MLSLEEAQQQILDAATPLAAEQLPLSECLGRVLSDDVIASVQLPPWDNSAMDGFAIRAAETPGELPISDTIAAGRAPGTELAPNTCMKIMTGAPVPIGADSVVMRENVEERESSALFSEPATFARHIRRAGEDVEVGSLLLPAQTELGPGELAILAAQGNVRVSVYRRPRVAILSTGDELVPLGQTPAPGQIISSNNITLAAQVQQAGAIAIDAGIVPDTMLDTVRALRSLQDYDILLTSGGVSVGDFDFVKDAYEKVGIANNFWKVAVKPGKPLAFGVRDTGQLVLGLPGNPASSLVSFELFVRPLLRKLMGHASPRRARVPVSLSESIAKRPGRTHIVRATLHREGAILIASPLSKQGSGMHRSMAQVDCFLELPRDAGDFAAGSTVNALVLGEAL